MFIDSPMLSDFDQACLHGSEGEACRLAMRFLVAAGKALNAPEMVSVSHCHLVGSYYGGEADLNLLRQLVDKGAKIRVPTSLSASSACISPGSPSDKQEQCQARSVVELYSAMGCDSLLSCAPYHMPAHTPGMGDCIAWAESNAVVYANTVLGARTNKTVQYLDLCAALTGRIPRTGLYNDEERMPAILVDASEISADLWSDDIGAQVLGLALGYHCPTGVPLIIGAAGEPNHDQLRGMGAAAASSGGLSLLHLPGITPEAPTERVTELSQQCTKRLRLGREQLSVAKRYLGEKGQAVAAVCLGAPHYSVDQLQALLSAARDMQLQAAIPIYVTSSRYNIARLAEQENVEDLIHMGIHLVADACSYYGQVIPRPKGAVISDSVKWVYYGGGNLNVTPLLGNLQDCLLTAQSGRLAREREPTWLM